MNDTQKTIAGTLMIGAGILSGNATLLTVAGGIGVNWASDGLLGLWDQAAHHFAPEEPLRRAYQRAITSAIKQLRTGYMQQTGRTEAQTFDLLAGCAGAVSQAQYLPDVVSVETAQHALARELDNLLYGHPERVQTYVKQSLLDAVALAFRDELAHDAEAWRRFHGWLIEQLSANVGRMGTSMVRVEEVLTRLQDAPAALSALTASSSRIEDMLREVLRRLEAPSASPAGSPSTVINFNNQGMQAQNVYQAETMNIDARLTRQVLPADLADPRDILAALIAHFNVTDMRRICFVLSVDDEDVIVGAKNASALELVKYVQRRDRLPDLVAAMRKVLGESGN
jgi:hypothetical protein